MKELILKIFVISTLLAGLAESSYAQSSYDWTGAVSNNWTTAGNWKIAGVTATTYPGQISNADSVKFGVHSNYTTSLTVHPALAATDSVSVGTVTVGDDSGTDGVILPVYLEFNGKLNITTNFLQKHSDNYGFVGDGSVDYPTGYDFHIQTYMWGTGKMYCNNMQIGDNTLPPNDGVANVTRFKMGNQNNVAGIGLTIYVANNFTINTQSRNDASGNIISVSNADVSLSAGSMTVGNSMIEQNSGNVYWDAAKPQFAPSARFTMDVVNNGENKTLYLKGATPLITPTTTIDFSHRPADGFGFWYVRNNTPVAQTTNLGTTTVNFCREGDQTIITAGSLLSSGYLGAVPCNWYNLVISGSGTKKFTSATTPNAASIAGNLTVTGTATLDLSATTVNPTITLSNGTNFKAQILSTLYTIPNVSSVTVTAGATFKNGDKALTIPGTTTNAGTFNTSTSVLTLAGAVANSGTFNQTGTGTITASSTVNNSGVYNENGTGALTLNGAVTNSGTFSQTVASTVIANGATTNTGTYTQNGTGTLTFNGTVTNTGGTISESNTGAITFNNTFNNSNATAIFNQTNGTINFNNSYSNTGTFKATAGTVNINQSGTQSLTDNSAAVVGNSLTPQIAGTTFFNVNVQNGGTKTMSGSGSGQFYVASKGTLTMSATTILASNGFLTLNSDATGSATVAAIPSGCSVAGNVTVQRYVSANRAYRLASSPVYSGNDGTNNIYSVNYLKTNTYLTGTGSGFDKSGNPTLYLYRENLAPLYTTFLNSNFRGVGDISAAPAYTIDGDGGPYNIPVANGFMFYYRGSRKQASLATLTTAGAAATTDTLNAVGVLNQQSITVHNWYTPGSANLGYTLTSGDPTVEGYNLVGNPYASSVNFEALTTSSIAPFAYYLIPSGLQGAGNYGIYDATLHTGSNGATKVIPSGLGFFVHATNVNATLTFTEAAKVSTQVTGANLFMGAPPVENTVQYVRLQMALDTINSDETIIAFNDNAKAVFDQTEDAQYKAGTGKVSLSSMSNDRKSLVINKLPLANSTIIPLKVAATTDGTYTLNLKAITGIPQLYDVWLKDAYKKDSVNLRTTASYSFTIAKADTASFGAYRFTLVMSQNTSLAVQLTSFNANKVASAHQVQVIWNAVNEENYTHFTVERSNDNGKTFDVVGGLTSNGEGTYGILDRSPLTGDNIYRLKQEDYNSAISYSKPVLVQYSDNSNNLTGNSHLTVYPNPAVSNITLAINPKSQTATYSIRITNSVGMVVKQASTQDVSWKDNISNLLTGTYLIQVVDKNDNSLVGQTKFVKL